MTPTELLNTIRAHIDQQYEGNREKARYDDYYRGMNDGLDKLEQFLDILQEPEASKDDMEFCKTHCKGYRETGGKCFFDGSCDAKRKATQEPEVDCPKIKGWVARDEDGEIFIMQKDRRKTWTVDENIYRYYVLPQIVFPDLKVEDDPIEVELIFKKI